MNHSRSGVGSLALSLALGLALGPALAMMLGGQAAMPAAGQKAQASGTVVTIINREGKPLGEATLTESRHGLLVQASMTNLQAGPHGFHIHSVGKCDPPDFKTAGGHYNPTGAEHGMLSPAGYHSGDMPNLVAGPDKAANAQVFLQGVTIEALKDRDGSALVIHAKPDDYKTDPSGASGDRVGCGVIAPPR